MLIGVFVAGSLPYTFAWNVGGKFSKLFETEVSYFTTFNNVKFNNFRYKFAFEIGTLQNHEKSSARQLISRAVLWWMRKGFMRGNVHFMIR